MNYCTKYPYVPIIGSSVSFYSWIGSLSHCFSCRFFVCFLLFIPTISVTTDSNSSTFRLFRSTFANIRAQAKQFDAAPSFASAADSINPVTSYQGFREAVDVGSGVCTCVFHTQPSFLSVYMQHMHTQSPCWSLSPLPVFGTQSRLVLIVDIYKYQKYNDSSLVFNINNRLSVFLFYDSPDGIDSTLPYPTLPPARVQA